MVDWDVLDTQFFEPRDVRARGGQTDDVVARVAERDELGGQEPIEAHVGGG